MNPEAAEKFTQSIERSGEGFFGFIQWAHDNGVPKALGYGSTKEWVNKRVGGYIKIDIEERRGRTKALEADGYTQEQTAEILGVSQSTVSNDINSNKDSDPSSENENATTRAANEAKRAAILKEPADPEILPGIYNEDFFEGAGRIADESVDLIFTDPPYDKEAAHLYGKAARVAARILKPGGSFIAYSGQKYLPEVYGWINQPALRYWWTFAGVHSGGNQMLQKLGIRCGWKPIVWYVKGTRGDVSAVLADVVTGAREKSHHEWQQAESEALHFIEKLTFEGGLVVDLFLGGGTTKVAADKLRRRFIGFEIDAETVERAKKRIKEASE